VKKKKMNNIDFVKMHGTGNDFIMLNRLDDKISISLKIARELCDRHTGIGGDGLIFILPAENKNNDYKMRIFNSDGSEAEMCGNGIRCFTHYLISENITDKKKLKIETKAGLIKPEIIKTEGNSSLVRVNMGRPQFEPDKIPALIKSNINYIHDYKLNIDNNIFKINCVSMGNPHTIIFTNNIKDINLNKWGKKIENHPMFPEKTNVEFVEIYDNTRIKVRVWERGAGITLACGTGACATVASGIKNNLLDKKVTVHLPGGDLFIDWSGDNIYMTGPARSIFKGKIV